MMIAVHGVMRYPILGIGMHNFPNYSGKWRDVHVAYLQIAVEGGIPILILYLLFFWLSFANLRFLVKIRDLDRDTKLLVAALHSSLVGFVVGACFSPEAYQYFPYFTVGYTSVLVAIVRERQRANLDRQNSLKLQSDSYASDPRTNTLTFSH
jgi:O-antigen ligase